MNHQCMQDEAALLVDERRSERQGRTKAERDLRELQLHLAQQSPTSDISQSSPSQLDFNNIAFPLRPIGIIRSCFSRRNGTPRQPLLVPAARAALTLRPELHSGLFDGLKQYTHCWVLYIFHENTDLQRLWQDSYTSVKSKIRVPRLDGERLGVFATRSPHRPCPIGLSVAEIIQVEGSTIILGGADIVNGSPILDIKPYVNFCDSLPTAQAPAWVAPTSEDEPLEISSVVVNESVNAALKFSWEERKSQLIGLGKGKKIKPLYSTYGQYKGLVLQVLSRDIRSVTQRVKVPLREQTGVASVPTLQGNEIENIDEGKWHVELDGIDITYEVDVNEAGEKKIVVKTARCL